MSRWSRERTAAPDRSVPGVPAHHLFGIAVTRDAPELVLALRRHPRNRWPEAHVVRGTPAGAPPRAQDAAWVRVRSGAALRAEAIHEVLDVARDLGLRAVGHVPLDAVLDPPSDWIDRQVGRWAKDLEDDAESPMPRELESVGGLEAVRRLLARSGEVLLEDGVRLAAARAVGIALVNTPGLVAPQEVAECLTDALAQRDLIRHERVVAMLEGLHAPATLAARGVRDPFPGMRWAVLLEQDDAVAAATARLHAATDMPPNAEVALRLRELLRSGRPDVRAAALEALAPAHPDDGLLEEVAAIVGNAQDPALLRAAVRTQCGHLGRAAVPGWRRLASSTDPDDIATIERLLVRQGGRDDVPDAVDLAHRLLRRRLLADGVPPLGASLLAFLGRYRGHVDVDALFIELEARWERLPSDVRAHLTVRGLR